MNTVFGLTYLPLFHRSFMHTEAGLDAPRTLSVYLMWPTKRSLQGEIPAASQTPLRLSHSSVRHVPTINHLR